MLHLFPTINGLGFQVSVPIESNTFKGSDELFHQSVPFNSSITTRFNEMCNVLFGVAVSKELIKL